MSPTAPGWTRRACRTAALALLLALALFLVARGVVEVVTVDPTTPETYRDDWGGPHYLGVLLVHAGPGLAVIVLAVRYSTRRRRSARARTAASDAHQHN